MKKILYASVLLLFHLTTSAQIGVGTQTPAEDALIDVKSSSKGVLFTKVTNYTQFPKYNVAFEDLYSNDAELAGAVLFNEEDEQYYKYDGNTWIPAPQLGAFHNPTISRIKASEPVTAVCAAVVVFSGCINTNYIPLTRQINQESILVDNLDVGSESNNIIEIEEDGLYNITTALGLNSFGLTAGVNTIEYWVAVDVEYPGGGLDEWISLMTKPTYNGSIVLDVGDKNASASITSYLPAGSRLKPYYWVETPGLTFVGAAGYTSSTAHQRSFMSIQLIHKY